MKMKTLMLALLMLTQTIVSADTTPESTKPLVLTLSSSNQSDTTKFETTRKHQDGTMQTSIKRASTIIYENTLDSLRGQTSTPDTIATTKYESIAKSSSVNVQSRNPTTPTSYEITDTPSDVQQSSTTDLSVTTEFETTSSISGETIPTSNPSETTREHSDVSTLTSPDSRTVTAYETTSNFQGGQSSASDSIQTTLIENKSYTSGAKVSNPNLSATTVSKDMLNPSHRQTSTTYLSVTTEFETSLSPSGQISHTSNPSETTQKHSGETILNTLSPSIATEYQNTSKIAREQTSKSDATATTEIVNISNSSDAKMQSSEIYATTVSVKTKLATPEETFQTSNPDAVTRKYSDGSMSTNTNSITVTDYELTSILSGEQTFTPVPVATTEFEYTSNPSSAKEQRQNPHATTESIITPNSLDGQTSTTNVPVTTEFESTLNPTGDKSLTSNSNEANGKHSGVKLPTATYSSTAKEYEMTSILSGEQTFTPVPVATTEFEYTSNPSSAKEQRQNPHSTTESIITPNSLDGQTSSTNVPVTTEFESTLHPTGDKSLTSNSNEANGKHSGVKLPTATYSSTAKEYEMTSKIPEGKLATPNISITTVPENTSNHSNGKKSGSTEMTNSRATPDPLGGETQNPRQNTTINPEVTPTTSSRRTPSPNPKNNSASTTRSVQLASTPTRRSIFTKKPENLELQLSFAVKITKNFTKELNDTTSKSYKKLAADFKASLEISFRISPGFSHVVIKGFRNGSVICDYSAVYKDVKNISTLQTEITSVKKKIEQQKIGNATMAPVHMAEDFTKATRNLCEAFKEPCGKGYTCKSSDAGVITCTSFCAKKENKCQNRGKCFYDVVSSQTDCRCVHDEDYVYSGRYCENKHEKLAMSSTHIIIISSCAGGSVILSLIIVIIVMAVKRKGRGVNKSQYLDDEDDKHRSVGMDEMYPNRLSNPYTSKSRGNTFENEYQSGLPDTRYVGGRQHRVLTDDTGSETYLYQPFKQPLQGRPASATSSEPEARPERAGSVYDYIDTDATYQIKRPTFKMGYFNKV